MSACRVCGNGIGNTRHLFREQYIGLGEEFPYVECSVCGSLSLMDIPSEMAHYYPEQYYSYVRKPYNRLAGFLKGRRDRHYMGRRTMLGRVLSLVLPAPPYISWLRNLGLPEGSSILEVGSGSGVLLVNLKDAGYTATGIDLYVNEPVRFPNGAVVLSQSLDETSGRYDCIMLHHCLEHMANPSAAFARIRQLLAPDGKVLIRTPVAGTYAWRTYGRNWFQLDAPRHLAILSREGMRTVAERNGFAIVRTVFDSTASLFWASEQYRKGIALGSETSYAIHPERSIFTRKQVAVFEERAVKLNAEQDGDQAAYYLVRSEA